MKKIILHDDQNEMMDYYELKENILSFDNKTNYEKIIVFANLGLWYGRRAGVKKFNTLFDAISFCTEDANKLFYTTKNSTLKLEAIHHDGVNYFKFYKLIKGKKYAIKINELEGF